MDLPFNLDNLDDTSVDDWERIIEPVLATGTPEERHQLATGGYLNLASVLLYDMLCGKARADDFGYTLHLLDQAHRLMKDPLHEEYEAVLSMQVQFLFDHGEPDTASTVAQRCLELCTQWKAAEPESAEPDNRRGMVYSTLFDHTHDSHWWTLATTCLREAIQNDPLESRWDLYLERLFEVLPGVRHEQERLVSEIRAFCDEVARTKPGVWYQVAHTVKSLFDRNGLVLRPELGDWYVSLVEEAWKAPTFESTYHEVSELARFFENEGISRSRPEFLDKALANWQRMVGRQEDRFYAERSMMSCRLQKALLCHRLGDTSTAQREAELALADAWEREAAFSKDFSTQLNLAEFFQLIRATGLVSTPPALEDIRRHAQGAREKGEGFYAQPAMILVDVALEEGDESLAIHLLCQEFLLHELCLDSEVAHLQTRLDPRFERLHRLLREFTEFERQAHTDYYLDPSYTWPQVQTMTPDQTAAAWHDKMREILAREPIPR